MPELDISIVVPLYNEEESLPELSQWIKQVMEKHKFSYELVFVDDGSNDNSWKVIEDLTSKDSAIKALKFRRNYGKSAALQSGFKITSGKVVVTMDADLQDNPEEIPEMYNMIINDGYDLISGWKKKRYDPVFSKNIPSKFFNWTARRISRIKLHDFNCGLKVYRSAVVKSIEVYGEMHRYMPVLAKWAGFKKIGEKIVQHQERKYGKTKFGLERFLRGPLDLLSVIFISKFGKRPMHLFGTLGTIMFVGGFLFAGYLGFSKMYRMHHGLPTKLVTQSPYFYLALTTMIIGTLLFLAGFLGELISRSGADRNNYLIEKKLD